MTSVNSDSNPILPHPISLITISTIMFVLTLLSQIIDPVIYERKWLIQRLLLSTVPPLLGIVLSIRFFKEEKTKQRDQLLLIMSTIIAVVMGFLTLAYILLLLLLYVGSSISGLSVYFLSIGLWGLVGITLADSGIFYKSDIKYNLDSEISGNQTFSHKSSVFISRIFATSRNRIIALLISYIVLLLVIWILSVIGNHPISVS